MQRLVGTSGETSQVDFANDKSGGYSAGWKPAPRGLSCHLGVLICCVLGILASVTAIPLRVARAESPTSFRFTRPLTLNEVRPDEIVAFPLDSALFGATRDDYPDLRVFDDRNQEVPFQVEPIHEFREERGRIPHSLTTESLREQDRAIELIVVAAEGKVTHGLTFRSPQIDFERNVSVYGADAGGEWKLLVEGAVVFDYTRFHDLRKVDVPLPANAYRRFKVVVSDATDERESPLKQLTRSFQEGKEQQRTERTTVERRSFRIDRIEGWNENVERRVRKTVTSDYPVESLTVAEEKEKKRTVVSFTSRREPLTQLTLKTTSRNFSRRVRVEVATQSGVQTLWREIASGNISRVVFRGYQHQLLTIEFPEQRESSYRVIIENDDNPPLQVDGVDAMGTAYRGVFLTTDATAYRVAYGSESVTKPTYETPVILAALAREDFQPLAGILGEPVEQTGRVEAPTEKVKSLLNNWLFLGGVLVVMVIALSWSLYKASQRLSETGFNRNSDSPSQDTQ